MQSRLISSDVTIIESKIEIEFFFENRIESKSIFWLVFFRFWLTAILAKTTHCSKFKAWQLSRGKECWIRGLNYTNPMPQRTWRPRGEVATAASRCRVAIPPTPLSMTQSLLSPSCVKRAGDWVHLISTSPSIIGLYLLWMSYKSTQKKNKYVQLVSDCQRTCYVISAVTSLAKVGELAESFTRSSLQDIITR